MFIVACNSGRQRGDFEQGDSQMRQRKAVRTYRSLIFSGFAARGWTCTYSAPAVFLAVTCGLAFT